MSEFSRETLLNIIETDHVQCGEASALARIALAAMDSEPVAWMHNNNNIGIPAVTVSQKVGHYWMAEFENVQPLYRHAQSAPVVPVVPNEMTAEQAYEIGDYYGDPVDVFARGANWMRQHIIDSTLAAAPQSPGSEPATVPGKWIPVSEQMPEVGDIVLTAMGGVVNVGETECSAANCRFFTSVISGRELPATHWMPLSAGPQGGER
ncbi:Eaa1 [Klebsiella pneumoniae subsp. rhinoscleromatis]|nr:Eaa1 [Klebsiella pneumoniae subsp. rhinoscleromatis]